MSAPKSYTRWRLAGAVILLAGAGVFLFAQYRSARPRLPERAGDSGATAIQGPASPLNLADGPPFTWEERAEMREAVYAQLDLTPEQRARLDAIDRKYEGKDGWDVVRSRLEESAKVLTKEQVQKAAEAIRTQVGERLRERLAERARVLPPEEQKRYLERLEERIERGAGGLGNFAPGEEPRQ